MDLDKLIKKRRVWLAKNRIQDWTDADIKWVAEKYHTSASNGVLAYVSKQLPLDFVKWYSGMEEEKILKAYERWKNESGNLR